MVLLRTDRGTRVGNGAGLGTGQINSPASVSVACCAAVLLPSSEIGMPYVDHEIVIQVTSYR